MAKNFDHPKIVENYDEHIRQLIPGYELMHLHILALLETHLKEEAKIAIVGCGTGFELNYLLDYFPKAEFVVFDPSAAMLEKTNQIVQFKQQMHRVTILQGDTTVLQKYPENFDAVLSILVFHFVSHACKKSFLDDIYLALKHEGMVMSFDLMQFEEPNDQLVLKNLVTKIGLSEKQSQIMLERIHDDFNLMTVKEMKNLYLQAGYQNLRTFCQMSNFYGLKAVK